MQYALLIYEDHDAYPGGEQGEAWQAILNAHTAFGGEVAQAGIMRGGAGLKAVQTATTVRTQGGQQTVHDGPFAETREELGGFYLIEVADLDEAIAWARKVPLSKNGAIEIRPTIGPMPE